MATKLNIVPMNNKWIVGTFGAKLNFYFKIIWIKSYYVSEITLDIGNKKLLWQTNEQLLCFGTKFNY